MTADAPRTRTVGSALAWTSTAMRLALGGLFIFAAVVKLSQPQSFADAVLAFKILPDELARVATFVVPWTEMLAGVMLVLGLWTRSAALLLSLMLIVFIAGIVSVLARHLDVKCGCFGKFEVPCKAEDGVGACQIIRNTVLLGMAVMILVVGPGRLALERRGSAG